MPRACRRGRPRTRQPPPQRRTRCGGPGPPARTLRCLPQTGPFSGHRAGVRMRCAGPAWPRWRRLPAAGTPAPGAAGGPLGGHGGHRRAGPGQGLERPGRRRPGPHPLKKPRLCVKPARSPAPDWSGKCPPCDKRPRVCYGQWLMSTLPSLLAGPCALFLDFDGTLAELAPRPDELVVPRELVALLERLHAQLDGALALVTGRAQADIDPLLAPLLLPAAFEHGAVRRSRLGTTSTDQRPDLGPVLVAAQALAAHHPGLLVEHKKTAVALHFRLVG